MKTVLIIDSDLGFVFWLGRILADAGCQPLPARDASEAGALLGQLNAEIDLLILNPSLTGADDFANALRRLRQNVKILAALSDADQSAAQVQGADIIARKPVQLDGATCRQWVGMIKQVLGILANGPGGTLS